MRLIEQLSAHTQFIACADLARARPVLGVVKIKATMTRFAALDNGLKVNEWRPKD